MHYDDLSNYSYEMPNAMSRIRNIGWLSRKFEFKQSIGSVELKEQLALYLTEWNVRSTFCFNQTRGLHFCELCSTPEMTADQLYRNVPACSAEILIPDITRPGAYFATPGLIAHYIAIHDYAPPTEFIQSVLAITSTYQAEAQQIFDAICAEQEKTPE